MRLGGCSYEVRAASSGIVRLLALAAAVCALLVASAASGAEPRLTLRREGERLVVTNRYYEATVDPEMGGRIVSFVVDGTEMTALCADGHGGLMEEVHSADFPFELLEQEWTEGEVSLLLAATTGRMRILRRYGFQADRPFVSVTHTFANTSRHGLAGESAPALRSLALPAGGTETGRELYCRNRGLGAEIVSAPRFLAGAGRIAAPLPSRGQRADTLRWLAVAEPAARRALGFALLSGGGRLLRPFRPAGPGIVVGWSCPAVPAGHSMTFGTLIVPLDGLAAVAELNMDFVADSLPGSGRAPLTDRFSIMPVSGPMREVSVFTRAYDEAGRELALCDSLALDLLESGRLSTGAIRCPGDEEPAWLLHEVYSEGARVGQFAVSVGPGRSAFPLRAPQPPLPDPQPLDGRVPSAPGSLVPLTDAQRQSGLLLWRFDGAPALTALEQLRLTVAQGEKRTIFLGVKALRPFEGLRFALAGVSGEPPGEIKPLPPSAFYLWQVNDDADGVAWLTPLSELTFGENQTRWLALTADTSPLKPGRYAGSLVASAEDVLVEVPVYIEVLRRSGPGDDLFPLWYLDSLAAEQLPETMMAKLQDHGVSGLTVADRGDPGRRRAVGLAQQRGLGLLAFSGPGEALPPAGPSGGLMLLPCPRPIWLMRAGGTSLGALNAAARTGYGPALLCERLSAVRPALLSGDGSFPFWLVKDGCEPGAVPRLIESGALSGMEPIWVHLDLTGADWRQAATQVRGALWVAAWQGLAGLAVSCPAPSREVDRQSALWHVLRDARRDVALWRHARLQAEQAMEGGEARTHALFILQQLERVVGTADGSHLRLEPERGPFRRLYRVAAPAGRSELTIAQFDAARDLVLALMGELEQDAPGHPQRQLYWQRIPLLDDDQVRWAIAAPDGEASWSTALAFQKAVADLTGTQLPVTRTFMEPGAAPEEPLLVWVVTDRTDLPDLPAAACEALAGRGAAPLASVRLENGAVVAFIRNDCDVETLMRAFRNQPNVFAPAHGVR